MQVYVGIEEEQYIPHFLGFYTGFPCNSNEEDWGIKPWKYDQAVPLIYVVNKLMQYGIGLQSIISRKADATFIPLKGQCHEILTIFFVFTKIFANNVCPRSRWPVDYADTVSA